jgi:uncharacterized protein with FMN-binding domain
LPSSKILSAENNKYTKKRPWILSTIVMVAASVGGAFGINAIWLNPATDTGGSAASATKAQTVKGDAIEYRFGVIELEVTATNGKIEKITELQATASPDWLSAIPILNDAALKAQKADFGNLSGATFTTQAYQQSLASAISKLN